MPLLGAQALSAPYFFEHLMSDSLPALQSVIAVACLSAALHHAGFGIELLHSGHQDSFVRGIVICYTKFVGIHVGEGDMRRARC